MKSGPKPLKPAVRLLRGSRTRSRHAAANATPAVAQPVALLKMPQWLSLRAKDFWYAEIRPRQFPESQLAMAIEYCSARALWEAERQQLQQELQVLESPGGMRYANPRSKVVKELFHSMQELSAQLGLDQALPVLGSPEEQQAAQAKSKQRFFA